MSASTHKRLYAGMAGSSPERPRFWSWAGAAPAPFIRMTT